MSDASKMSSGARLKRGTFRRVTTVSLLMLLLLIQPAATWAATTPAEASQWVQATFIALDAASARVTYRPVGSNDLKTAPVSSPATVEKLAKIQGGKKVVLKCRVTQPGGEVTVDDAKKKANWAKRVIILGLVVGLIVAASTAQPEI